MKARFIHTRIAGLVSVACAALVLPGCGPSAGVKALQASREAIRAANSWQVSVSMQTRSGWQLVRIDSVECPGRLDRTGTSPDSPSNSYRQIWFGGVHYEVGPRGTWTATDMPPPAGCGAGLRLATGGFLYDDLDAIGRDGEVRRSPPFGQPRAEDCTWWDAAPAKGADPKYSVCLNDDDHLPRSIRSVEQEQTYVYTLPGWNVTKVTLPSDIVVPAQ